MTQKLLKFLILTFWVTVVNCASSRSVVRGSDVTLTCNKVSTSGPVWWDKQLVSGGTQTLSIDNALQGGIDEIKYKVDSIGQTFALTIRKVQPSDDGNYRCFNLFGDATAEITTLTVLVQPKPVNVTGAENGVSEGSLLDLICSSENGKPKPALRWSKKGSENTELTGSLKEITNSDGTFTVTKTLSLAVGRDTAGAIFLCTSTVADIPYNETIEVPLIVNLKPLPPVLSGNNEADENNLLTFSCLSPYGRPAASVLWYRGPDSQPQNETLTGSDSTTVNGDGSFNMTSTATFIAKFSDDQKKITCTATNVVLQNLGQAPQSVSDVITVNHKPIVAIPNKALSVDEGNSLVLECNIRARPAASVSWTRNIQPVNISDTSYTGGTPESPSLVIASASASHKGAYTCSAENRLGRTSGATINVVVRHAPLITMGPGLLTSVREGNNVILHCTVTANPTELDFIKWYRNNVEINVSDDPRISGGNTTLTINASNRTLDAGLYKCRARNALGEREGKELKLEVQYPPEEVTLSHTVIDIIEGSVPEKVSCSALAIPSASFEWYHAGTGTKKSSGATLSFPPVSGRDFGEYKCRASNKWGVANGYVFMNVSFTPYCMPGQKLKYGAKQGVSISIACHVLANPTLTAFDVKLGTKSVWSEVHSSTMVNSAVVTGSFSYTARSTSDFGKLSCNATNAMGSLNQLCQIEVVPAGPSEAPSGCKVKMVSETSITVACVAGFDGGSTQYFTLQSKVDIGYKTETNGTIPTLTAVQLMRGTLHTFRVCSSNTDFPNKLSCSSNFEVTTKGNNLESKSKGQVLNSSFNMVLFCAAFINCCNL